VGIVLKVFLSLIPFLITLILDIYFIGCILKEYIRRDKEHIPTEVRNLVLYPIIFLISWIWIMTERFYEMITDGDEVGWLNDIDLQGSIISGFLNALIYGYVSINPFKSCCEDTASYEDEERHGHHHHNHHSHGSNSKADNEKTSDLMNTNLLQ